MEFLNGILDHKLLTLTIVVLVGLLFVKTLHILLRFGFFTVLTIIAIVWIRAV
jgi:hypothetical protein